MAFFERDAQTAQVVWRDWGDEAFETARREGKPVLLMIGFSACRWCARQWEEMRASAQLTALLARRLVCVAVDRDVRPDIDAAYLAARSAQSQTPGWPLLALLTPGRLPFFLSGYLPAGELLETLREALATWENGREKLEALARRNVEAARARFRRDAPQANLTPEIYSLVRSRFAQRYDARFGGFGTPPKFPMPQCMKLLLRIGALSGDGEALRMGLQTLQGQLGGAIFDHVGGGVLRYALDPAWRVPEKEKLLSDNALFADTCMEAWEITREPTFLVAAERTLAWMLREMRGENGAFYSAQWEREGVDSFALSRANMLRLLGDADGEAFCIYYGITGQAMPSRQGHDGIETPRMLALCERVWRWRRENAALLSDEKMTAVSNALAVQALARAYTATGRELYREAAEAAAQFLRGQMTLENGTVAVCWQGGRRSREGFLDDTAQTANAALALYEATLDGQWLDWAVRLCRAMLEQFAGPREPGFAMTPHGAEKLIALPVETYDGALPSSNAAALSALVALDRLDIGSGWREAACRQADFLAGCMAESPQEHAAALLAAMPLLYPSRLLECRASAAENERLLVALRGRYQPLLFKKATQPGPLGSRWIFTDGLSAPAPMREMENALERVEK